MTIVQTLDEVVTSTNANTVKLRNLLGQVDSETLKSDNPTLYPNPIYDPATSTYTLRQNTAVGSVYEGVYRIPAADGCARLEVVIIISHTAPPSGAPARTRLCGQGVYTDQPSVSALVGKEVTAFTIRSGSPFEVKVKLTDARTWCYTFNFTIGQQG